MKPARLFLLLLGVALACGSRRPPMDTRTCMPTVTEESLCRLSIGRSTHQEITSLFCSPAYQSVPSADEAVLVYPYADGARTATLSFWFRHGVLVHISVISASDGDIQLPACLRAARTDARLRRHEALLLEEGRAVAPAPAGLSSLTSVCAALDAPAPPEREHR